ncbi:MAG: leucine-rich repeat domain-containing protein [Lachnospiraceae bacterium]|nr:leucine-rich repeat domain-containing protein [Lachnospiraceae bacterium]
MKTRKLMGVLLLILALVVLQLPYAEADAATSASNFSITADGVLTKYTGTEGKVTIPSSVLTVATDAFKDNTHITSVTIPDSVEKIEAYAFWGCANLQSVSIGSGLKEIGDYVFANCKGLSTMTIPGNITTIGIKAFEDDVNLTDITIPYQTFHIHETAFDGCSRLVIHAIEGTAAYKYATDFYVRQAQMPEYEDVAEYTGDETTPENGEGEGGSDAGDEAEAGNAEGSATGDPEEDPLTFHFTPSSDGTYYGSDANLYVTGGSAGKQLSSVHIVGNRAVFFMDNADGNVYYGNHQPVSPEGEDGEAQVAENGTRSAVTDSLIPKYTIVDGRIVADQAYYKRSDLNHITLPETITSIGQFSYARSSVNHIDLPEGLTEIGYGAFYHCDRLQSVEIPATVMTVEPQAFGYTAWVNEFLADGTNGTGDFLMSGGVIVSYRGTVPEVTLPEGARVIAAGAFSGHTEIESVRFPDSMVSAGEESFYGCSSLREVYLNQGLQNIKDRAFAGCALSTVDLPESVNALGLQAFDGGVTVNAGGAELQMTHEPTAERLSNKAFRQENASYGANPAASGGVVERAFAGGAEDPASGGADGVSGDPAGAPDPAAPLGSEYEVPVTGVSDAQAYLAGEKGGYQLTMIGAPSDIALDAAMERASSLHTYNLSGGSALYQLNLTDATGLPVTRLGRQGLTVAIPVPLAVSGQEVIVATTDRNGQLELLPTEIVTVGETTYVRFTTYHLSPFALYGTGKALSTEQILTADTVFVQESAAPVTPSARELFTDWVESHRIRLMISAGITLVALLLLFVKVR